jgi:hypothetical protein
MSQLDQERRMMKNKLKIYTNTKYSMNNTQNKYTTQIFFQTITATFHFYTIQNSSQTKLYEIKLCILNQAKNNIISQQTKFNNFTVNKNQNPNLTRNYNYCNIVHKQILITNPFK